MAQSATPAAHEYLVCRTGGLESGLSMTDAIDAYENDDGSLQAIYCHHNGTMWLVGINVSADNLEVGVRGERLVTRDEEKPAGDELLEYLRYEIQHVCRPDLGDDCDCEGPLVQHEVYVGRDLIELPIDTAEYLENLRPPWGRL